MLSGVDAIVGEMNCRSGQSVKTPERKQELPCRVDQLFAVPTFHRRCFATQTTSCIESARFSRSTVSPPNHGFHLPKAPFCQHQFSPYLKSLRGFQHPPRPANFRLYSHSSSSQVPDLGHHYKRVTLLPISTRPRLSLG